MMIGTLRHKISFITLSTVMDSFGQPTQTETVVNTVFASANSASGGLSYKDSQLFPEATEVFELRYVSGITMNMLVGFGDRRFRILNISNPKERNISLTITAKEIINGK